MDAEKMKEQIRVLRGFSFCERMPNREKRYLDLFLDGAEGIAEQPERSEQDKADCETFMQSAAVIVKKWRI